MQINNTFQVPLPRSQAWDFLMNIAEVAPCFPGVTLTDTVDADTQKGRIKVKLGPIAMIFAGTVHFETRDPVAGTATVKADWREEKGRGSATTMTHFSIREIAGGTEVLLESDVQLAGQVAQYGRGSGMIADISEHLIATFAGNLREKAQAACSAAPAATDESAAISVDNGQAAEEHKATRSAEISGFAILWKILRTRLRAWFSGDRT